MNISLSKNTYKKFIASLVYLTYYYENVKK